MILSITYSCFMSLFTIGFDMRIEYTEHKGDQVIFILEMIVFISFTLDIIFNFLRLPSHDRDGEVSHSTIAKKYFKSMGFFRDALATFPFFLLPYLAKLTGAPPTDKDAESNNTLTFFKFLRLARIPRIMRIFDSDNFNSLTDCLFANSSRGKKVAF